MKKKLIQIICISMATFLCTSIMAQNENEPVQVYKNASSRDANVPPPPPPPPVVCEMWEIIEEMPRFPGCEDQKLDRGDLENCSKQKMITYIYTNLEYPEQAKKKGIEGRSIIQFYIDIDGSMIDVKLVRGFEEECDEAALKVVKKMQSEFTWVPGKQRGRIVKVQYTLPIKFDNKIEKIDNKKNKEKFNKPSYSDAPLELPVVTDAPPPPPVVDKIFRPRRDSPTFQGCENKNLNDKELEECAKGGVLKYIYENLVYPAEAKKNGTEGMVVVQFVIDKSGKMQNIKLVRDIGDGCGKAALNVINKMQDENLWIPAPARGRRNKVQYTMPVKFKLDHD